MTTCDWLPLADTHHEFLVRVAATIVGQDEAEDVVQDVYVTLLGDHASFHGRSGAARMTWLTTVVRNAAIRRRRVWMQAAAATDKRAVPLAADENGAVVGRPGRTVAPYDPTRLDDQRRIDRAAACLTQLSPAFQETMLVWLRDRSYAIGAASLGITPALFKYRLHRARKKLKALVEAS